LWTLKRKPAPIQPVLTRLTSDSGWTSRPALSPDGKLVAYTSDRGSDHLNIWVRQIAGGDSMVTHEDDGASEPFFSPDSSKIVFRSERDGGGVYVVSALGGEASVVAKGGRAPRFSPDGAWIVFGPPCAGMREEYIQVMPTAGGEPRRLGADLNFACHPVWSPDGRSVLALGSKGPPELDTVEWWIAYTFPTLAPRDNISPRKADRWGCLKRSGGCRNPSLVECRDR
jgi:Tol biopolymer transport system component